MKFDDKTLAVVLIMKFTLLKARIYRPNTDTTEQMYIKVVINNYNIHRHEITKCKRKIVCITTQI